LAGKKISGRTLEYSDKLEKATDNRKGAAQRLNQIIITLSGAPTAVSGKSLLSYAWTAKVGNTAGPKTAPRGHSERAAQSFKLSHISESRP
jgi:hypothetical protein